MSRVPLVAAAEARTCCAYAYGANSVNRKAVNTVTSFTRTLTVAADSGEPCRCLGTPDREAHMYRATSRRVGAGESGRGRQLPPVEEGHLQVLPVLSIYRVTQHTRHMRR
jgi:hypothetical protein